NIMKEIFTMILVLLSGNVFAQKTLVSNENHRCEHHSHDEIECLTTIEKTVFTIEDDQITRDGYSKTIFFIGSKNVTSDMTSYSVSTITGQQLTIEIYDSSIKIQSADSKNLYFIYKMAH